jgi:hypothetical protein
MWNITDIPISYKSSLYLSIIVWTCWPVSAHAETSGQLECWKEIDTTTHNGAVCTIKRSLESMWEIQLRNILETGTDLIPGDINKIVPKLFLQWAECEYEAVVDFFIKRSDIPLRLLLATQTNEQISEEESAWLNQQTGFEPHIAELDKCKDEWVEAVGIYFPDSPYAE